MTDAPNGCSNPSPLPTISIITPSFQQAHFLERAIRSVVAQSYPAVEHIVIDGGSTDGSVEIIERYASHLAHWESKPDRGQSHAINKGLDLATGEIVGWLNSDDSLAPATLTTVAAAYMNGPSGVLYYGHTNLIDENDRVVHRLVAVPTTAAELITRNRNIISQPGTMWRKDLHQHVGLLDETLDYAMDCDFFIRAGLCGNLVCLPHHLGNLRIHSQTKSALRRAEFLHEQKILDVRYGPERRDWWSRNAFRVRRAARALRKPKNVLYYLGRRD